MTLNLNTVCGYGILDIDLHVAFEVCDLITKLHKKQTELIRNSENENVHRIGQDEIKHREYTRLHVCDGQAYYRSCD
jgi:hypothetical protein